jgi:hypothetical protein
VQHIAVFIPRLKPHMSKSSLSGWDHSHGEAYSPTLTTAAQLARRVSSKDCERHTGVCSESESEDCGASRVFLCTPAPEPRPYIQDLVKGKLATRPTLQGPTSLQSFLRGNPGASLPASSPSLTVSSKAVSQTIQHKPRKIRGQTLSCDHLVSLSSLQKHWLGNE